MSLTLYEDYRRRLVARLGYLRLHQNIGAELATQLQLTKGILHDLDMCGEKSKHFEAYVKYLEVCAEKQK